MQTISIVVAFKVKATRRSQIPRSVISRLIGKQQALRAFTPAIKVTVKTLLQDCQ